PPHIGGMETHLQALCTELTKRLDIRVLVANDGRDDQNEVIDGVPVTRVGTTISVAGAPICTNMAEKIAESGVDLLHIHMPNPMAALAYLTSGFEGPVVLTWHSDIIRQKVLKTFFAPIERRVVRRAAAIIASSPDYVAYSPILYEHRARCWI